MGAFVTQQPAFNLTSEEIPWHYEHFTFLLSGETKAVLVTGKGFQLHVTLGEKNL